MNGKEIIKKFEKLNDYKDRYDYCIDVLENINDDWRTEPAIKALKEKRGEVILQIKKLKQIKTGGPVHSENI